MCRLQNAGNQALMHFATHGKGADEGFKEGAPRIANPKVVKIWAPPDVTPPKSADSLAETHPPSQGNWSKRN